MPLRSECGSQFATYDKVGVDQQQAGALDTQALARGDVCPQRDLVKVVIMAYGSQAHLEESQAIRAIGQHIHAYPDAFIALQAGAQDGTPFISQTFHGMAGQPALRQKGAGMGEGLLPL